MEYVILVLLANPLGQIEAVGTFPIVYATHELCEAARPAAVALVQKEVDIRQPGHKVTDSKCVSQAALNKVQEKIQHTPLKGQKDASIH